MGKHIRHPEKFLMALSRPSQSSSDGIATCDADLLGYICDFDHQRYRPILPKQYKILKMHTDIGILSVYLTKTRHYFFGLKEMFESITNRQIFAFQNDITIEIYKIEDPEGKVFLPNALKIFKIFNINDPLTGLDPFSKEVSRLTPTARTHASNIDWDGKDHYTKKYIGDNWGKSYGKEQIELDHMKSKYMGYMAGDSPIDIAHQSNLALTTKSNNCKKNKGCHIKLIKKLREEALIEVNQTTEQALNS